MKKKMQSNNARKIENYHYDLAECICNKLNLDTLIEGKELASILYTLHHDAQFLKLLTADDGSGIRYDISISMDNDEEEVDD